MATTQGGDPSSILQFMNLDHLAIVVADQDRSRHFYETYFGFGQGPPSVYEDGTLIIRNSHGFALALHPTRTVPPQHEFSHFGFGVANPDEVRAIRKKIENAGLNVVEVTEETKYVSFKFLDPDGYKVEVSWET
jgi:catechol 2,3-dioxygenase-like lactoylglutathione lyase family enzyme